VPRAGDLDVRFSKKSELAGRVPPPPSPTRNGVQSPHINPGPGSTLIPPGSRRTCSARSVVDHWANGASKPEPLLDGRVEFRDGIWARLLSQLAMASVGGQTALRPDICAWLNCMSFGSSSSLTRGWRAHSAAGVSKKPPRRPGRGLIRRYWLARVSRPSTVRCRAVSRSHRSYRPGWRRPWSG
jgi:hypothetical protein